MVEAHAAQVATNDGHTVPANVVGYDSTSGFGLLQSVAPLKVRPMALGKSAELHKGDPVIAASAGGPGALSRSTWWRGASLPAAGNT